MADAKKQVVKFTIRGFVELGEGVKLSDALTHLEELRDKTRELGTVQAFDVTVPRTRTAL